MSDSSSEPHSFTIAVRDLPLIQSVIILAAQKEFQTTGRDTFVEHEEALFTAISEQQPPQTEEQPNLVGSATEVPRTTLTLTEQQANKLISHLSLTRSQTHGVFQGWLDLVTERFLQQYPSEWDDNIVVSKLAQRQQQ